MKHDVQIFQKSLIFSAKVFQNNQKSSFRDLKFGRQLFDVKGLRNLSKIITKNLKHLQFLVPKYLKIAKNRASGTSNLAENVKLWPSCVQRRLGTSNFQFFNDFWPPKWRPKSLNKWSKIDVKKRIDFLTQNYEIWIDFGMQNRSKIDYFCVGSNFQKLVFYYSKTNVFRAQGTSNTTIFEPRNACSKTTAKKPRF